MTSLPFIGFALGALAAAAALFALVPVRHHLERADGKRGVFAAVAMLAPLLALILIADANDSRPDPVSPASPDFAPPAEGAMVSDDWTTMAHAYLGGPPPGTAQAGTDGGVPPSANHAVDELLRITVREPDNAQAWSALAGAQRRARDFAAAASSYERALNLDANDADTWADYADALGSTANRRLQGRPADAITRALKLDPRHTKALWLQATLDLELRQYADALARWQQLRAVLPAGSPDIRIVDANIAEARQLVADAGPGR